MRFLNKLPDNYLRGIIITLTLYCLILIGIVFIKATFTERLTIDDITKVFEYNGNKLEKGALVIDAKEGGVGYEAGIRAGDTIIYINGNEISDFTAFQNILNRSQDGEILNYTVIRNGQLLNFKVNVYKYFHLIYYVFFTLSFGFLVIGFIVGYSKPKEYVSQIFFLLGCAASLGFNVFGGIWYYINSDSFIWYNFTIGEILVFPLFFHFFSIYPIQYNFKLRRSLIAFAYIYVFVLVTAFYFLSYSDVEIGIAIRNLLGISPVIFLFAGIALFIRSYTKIKEPQLKKSLKVIAIGFLIGAIGLIYYFFLFSIVYERFGMNPVFRIPTILVLAIPLSFGYSIFKYRILDTEFIVKKSLVFGFVTAIIIGIYLTVLYIIDSLLSQFLVSNRQLITISLIIIITFSFDFVNKKVKEFVDKQFYRERYNYRQALLKFAEELPYIKNINEILSKIGKSIYETIGIESINIWLNNKYYEQITEADESSKNKSEKLNEAFRELFSYNPEPLSLYEVNLEVIHIKPVLKEMFKEEKIVLSVPVFLKNNLLGAINFGKKKSGKAYSDEDIDLLKTLASQSAIAFENARLQTEEMKRRKFEEELRIAQTIQEGLLPNKKNIIKGIEIECFYKPAKIVGGDFYDLIKIDEDKILIVVADVSGKGIPAALYMSKIQAMIQIAAKIYKNPKDILIEVNKQIKNKIEKKSFVTVVMALFDLKDKTARICRAGHPPVIYKSKNGTNIVWDKGIGIGLVREGNISNEIGLFKENMLETEIKFYDDDYFLFYSDGLIEAMDTQNELFGTDRLLNIINSNSYDNTEEMKEKIINSVSEFRNGREQNDDITFVIGKIKTL